MNKISLAGAVILRNQSILLLHRKNKDWYELPGGKIDSGETAESTAIREIKEELGCDIKIIKKLGTMDFSENGYVMQYNWFLAMALNEPKINEPDKYDHFKYIPINELSKHRLSSNMQNLAREITEKRILL